MEYFLPIIFFMILVFQVLFQLFGFNIQKLVFSQTPKLVQNKVVNVY